METSAPETASSPPGIGPKPWGLPAILLALALLTFLVAPSFFVDAPEEFSAGEIVASLILTIFLKDIPFIAVAAGFALWRYGLGWRGLGLRSFDPSLWWLPLVAAAGAIVGIAVYGFVLIALGAEAATPEQEDLEQLFDSRAVLPLTGVAIVIIAPLSEEIFFRGFIFPALIRPFGLAGAMAASGLVFAAVHVTDSGALGVLLPFTLIGVLFAWIYYRTGSLWPSIATHLLFNVVGFTAGALGG